MIRRASTLAALLAVLTLPSAAALAQDYEELPPALESSLYLQMSAALGIDNFDGFANNDGSDSSGGFGVRVGLRTSKWSALEAQFEWFRGMMPAGNDSGDDWTTTFNWRIYPLNSENGRVQPYLLLGAGITSYKLNLDGCSISQGDCTNTSREFGFSSRWGGGLDIYLTDKVAVTFDASYVWAAGTPIKDLSYMSLGFGVLYRFY